EESARRLKVVFDSHGAFVRMSEISDAPDFVTASGTPEVIPREDKLPDVKIVKRDGRWLWTRASLDWLDREYVEGLGGLERVVESLPAPFKTKIFGVSLWQYLALLMLVAVGWLGRRIIVAVVTPRLRRWSKRLGKKWPHRLLDVVASPGATLITAVVLGVGYPRLQLPIRFADAMAKTVDALTMFSFVWAVYKAADLLGAWLAERAEATDSKLDDQLVPLVRKTLKIIIATTGTLAILQNLEFEVTTLLTSVSIGTLAVGLAAKDTIANLFGSVSIFVDNPFQIGDWIEVDGTNGTVEEVGFRSTRIRTFYNSVVVMPNAKVADAKVDNFGKRQYRRCYVTLGLTYDTTPDQMQAFCEGCKAIILAHPRTRKDSYEVHMSGFGDSALEVMFYFFFACETWTEELEGRHQVFLEVMRLAQDLGCSFAFPTQSLHLASVAASEARPRRVPAEAAKLAAVVRDYGPEGARARPAGPNITGTTFNPVAGSRRGADDDGG
ncbi:MAG: mechanosensitive ion channel family protein, partial [Myxococcota bacterium]